MPVTGIINYLKYDLWRRYNAEHELESDPLVNPEWLERSKAEEIVIENCLDSLREINIIWKTKGPIKKRLKVSKAGLSIGEKLSTEESLDILCPYSQYGSIFGISFDKYKECTACKLKSECSDKYKKVFKIKDLN